MSDIKTTQVTGWSEKYYTGITREQHQANNDWFNSMRRMLKPGGLITVPDLGYKSFTEDGEEV
jgi:DNA modification methylase